MWLIEAEPVFSKFSKHVLEAARLAVMGDMFQVDNLREEIRRDLIRIELLKQTLVRQDLIL